MYLCSTVAETLTTAYESAESVSGFDRPGRAIMVDVEKGCGSAIDNTFRHAQRFLDERHVVKNTSSHLGTERARSCVMRQGAAEDDA